MMQILKKGNRIKFYVLRLKYIYNIMYLNKGHRKYRDSKFYSTCTFKRIGVSRDYTDDVV